MHVIGDATDPETFAIRVSGNRGEVGVERGTNGGIKDGSAVFGAEDDVDQEK